MLMVQMMAWLQSAHTQHSAGGVCVCAIRQTAALSTPGQRWKSALDAVDANRRSQERLKPEDLRRGGEPEPQSHSVLLVKTTLVRIS